MTNFTVKNHFKAENAKLIAHLLNIGVAKITYCIMREWEKFSTNYIRKKAEVITFAASKSRTFSFIFF